MSGCTVFPKRLKKWFDSKFLGLCQQHDTLYKMRVWRTKFYADLRLALQISERGYVGLAYLTLFVVTTFGTVYWLWKWFLETKAGLFLCKFIK